MYCTVLAVKQEKSETNHQKMLLILTELNDDFWPYSIVIDHNN